MKKLVMMMAFAAMLITGFSCLKKNDTTCSDRSVAQDEPAILSYLAANSITGYVKHSSGLYYKVLSSGTGATPGLSSKVYVKYTGKFTNNNVFETVTDASKTGWVLGSLIQGWQVGIPLVSKGGSIQLFIPSAMAYGCNAPGTIPANSILIFQIDLVDVL
jgi:FKBP-type peptidyl-prolyl cis-trans isomerase FkpA